MLNDVRSIHGTVKSEVIVLIYPSGSFHSDQIWWKKKYSTNISFQTEDLKGLAGGISSPLSPTIISFPSLKVPTHQPI